MFGLGPIEMLIVGVIAVLLFGKNLPSVGRSLGKSLVEFKKGLNEIKSEVDAATYSDTPSRVTPRYSADDLDEPTAPKFEPPTQAPTETVASDAAATSTTEATPASHAESSHSA